MNTFRSFDGLQIAYHDEGTGPAVLLLHGGYVDGLSQFGDFERILPLLERRQEMFREVFGGALPLPNPPVEGRPGLVRSLRAAGARTILPDLRGFGASDKPREKTAYEDSAMARDVVALMDHLRLDVVDVIGFSMGAGTAARLLLLRPPPVKSAILAGFGDYAIEDHVMEFPKNWPVPDSVPRPITARVWLEEGAKILEKGEIVPGHLASANLIGARVTGTDPKVMAAVIRGALMESLSAEALQRIDIPVLILNGKADAANLKIAGLLQAIPTARAGECEGDHSSTPYEPTFQQAVVQFFEEQWRLRGCVTTPQN
ncbi:MAG: alpha/beta hydrolase [Acidobacteriaceae bacterium]|nr:alpha/beta hydrolase [Acidobacteriaceae bacterium]MBV9227266.1 alpha/beta hydrolase [Acidobacteriaceae bacterium]MBV9304689.1 alpha/beta hydrolase [Acidobacteriaceae bacterium]